MKRWEQHSPDLEELALSAINMHVSQGVLSASGWVQTTYVVNMSHVSMAIELKPQIFTPLNNVRYLR